MRVHKKIGTKGRLFEMFENVNNIKLNESLNPVLNNDFINVLVGDADLQYMESENPDALEFDVMDAIYIFRHDYNEDNPSINWLGTLPSKYHYKPSPMLNGYDELSEEGKRLYDTLVQGEDFYTDHFLDGGYNLGESVNELDYHQKEDNESEPDVNSTYTLKDDNFERLQIDSVSRANNHENVNNGWKFIERKPSNNGSYSYHWRNTGNPDVQWTFGKQNVEKVVPMHQDAMIKEDVNNEVGTDSGIFQMLLAYVTKNSITEEEFQVGELTVQILANPTTWDDTPYIAASRMQPEEGGYPENVKGEISDIVIWDREDNEYKLSNDALQRLNQNVSFDGNLLDDITEKAANGGEDEYSRADFARKDSMENEGSIKEDDVNDITRKYIDNIEGLSPERKAELIARQTAPQDNSPSNYEFKRMPTSNGLFRQGEEPKNRGERRSAGIGGDFSKNIKDKLKETSYTDLTKKTGVDMMEGIRFNYDQKGNWIPEGYEDKKIALRPLEQPLGSDNWKVALVTLDVNGDLDDIIKTTDTWEEAKNALHASIT